MSEFVVQAIGFVGVAFFIASYQIKSNKALFLCQMIGCSIFCVQFFIMGVLGILLCLAWLKKSDDFRV